MKVKKAFTPSMVLAAAVVIFTACDKEEVQKTSADITVQATAAPLTVADSKQGRIVVSDFRINMKEIEFEFDDDDKRATTDIAIKDVKLKGPFEFDLLDPNKSLTALAAVVTLPNARYEEVEFHTHKGASGIMQGKSVLMTGTIDGKPFEFSDDIDTKFEVEFENEDDDIVINGQDQHVIITYKLGTLLSATAGIDLTSAKDGNNNGKIEISTKDTDGNQNLAKAIRDNLKNAIRLLEEK